MFGSLGLPELLFIFALGLVIFGPKRLPQVGRTVGRGLAEFRKASTDLRRTINAELMDDDLKSAHPGKIVRDTLSDMKRGLDGDFKSAGEQRPSPEGGRSSLSGDPAGQATSSSAESESAAADPEQPGSSTSEQPSASDEPAPPIIAAKGAVPRGPKPARSSRAGDSEPKGTDETGSEKAGQISADPDGANPSSESST